MGADGKEVIKVLKKELPQNSHSNSYCCYLLEELGVTYERLGMLRSAERCYREVLKKLMGGSIGRIRTRLGILQLRMGNAKEAAKQGELNSRGKIKSFSNL